MSEPATFVPVIQTRIEKPMSAVVGVYVLLVAPGICTQRREIADGVAAPPRVREGRSAVEPSHVPAVSVNGVSTMFPPRICGVARSLTASAITGALDSEFCAADPWLFVAVTWTRNRLPVSAVTGV